MADYIDFPTMKEVFQNYFTSILSATILIVVVTILYYKFSKKKVYNLPPGPSGLPILGYLPFFGTEPHKDLDRLKKQYGNVFGLYMGLAYVVILGDYEAVKDAFSKTTTTDRPEKAFEILPDEFGFNTSNGLEWMEQRKFCMKSLGKLGVGKNNWESIIQVEVQDFVELVSSFNGQLVEISDMLTLSISNNICAFVFGTRFPPTDPDIKMLITVVKDVMLAFDQTSIHSFFPIIRSLYGILGLGHIRERQANFVKFNEFVRNEIRKIKQSYKSGEHENFIADYLREMDSCKDKSGHFFTDRNLAGNIQALFVAGSETTKSSIYWLLLIMAHFRQIQERVQKEIDDAFDKREQIQWSDRKKLPYTMSVIMEGQRWKSVAYLNLARQTSKDTKIQGYDIPKGTLIIANIWGLHHDCRYWKNPEIFQPERFLTEDGKETKQNQKSYIPFSIGKRNCPGEAIAMMEIFLYFSNLIREFKIMAPHNRKVDLTGILGLGYLPPAQDLSFIRRT